VRRPTIDIIAAVAANGVIGKEGGLPFRLSTDLKRFKALTMGHPVIMGRKTHASIGRLLPGRLNIIVSRNPAHEVEGAVVVKSLDQAVAAAAAAAHAEDMAAVFIIGGGEIYAQAINRADRLHITHVLADIAGDTVFPAIDPGRFEPVSQEDVPAGPADSHATRFVTYRKRSEALGHDPRAD
jgi:dihydrofolate reductase